MQQHVRQPVELVPPPHAVPAPPRTARLPLVPQDVLPMPQPALLNPLLAAPVPRPVHPNKE
ncbi:MAG: hypothetical protein Pars93KO_22660 [Parasphingorhabdus sp.]